MSTLPDYTCRIKAVIIDDEPPARNRLRHFLKFDPEVDIVGEVGCVRDAINVINTYSPHLIFLDIQMPEADGFAIVDYLSSIEVKPIIIFVTAFDQYALKAFEVNALDYLLKPFERERFEATLKRAKESIKQSKTQEIFEEMFSLIERFKGGEYLKLLSVKCGERVLLLRTHEIDWIEAENNYVRVHIGKQAHFLRETLSNLEARLDPQVFIRAHRSAIVNINRITELQTWSRGDYRIRLIDGTEIMLTRRYRKNFDALVQRPL